MYYLDTLVSEIEHKAASVYEAVWSVGRQCAFARLQ